MPANSTPRSRKSAASSTTSPPLKEDEEVISLHSSSSEDEANVDRDDDEEAMSSEDDAETSTLVESPGSTTLLTLPPLSASQGTHGTSAEGCSQPPPEDQLVTQRMTLEDEEEQDDEEEDHNDFGGSVLASATRTRHPRDFSLTRVGRRTPPHAQKQAAAKRASNSSNAGEGPSSSSKKTKRAKKEPGTPACGVRRRSSGDPAVLAAVKEEGGAKSPPATEKASTAATGDVAANSNKESCVITIDQENRAPTQSKEAPLSKPSLPASNETSPQKARNDPTKTEARTAAHNLDRFGSDNPKPSPSVAPTAASDQDQVAGREAAEEAATSDPRAPVVPHERPVSATTDTRSTPPSTQVSDPVVASVPDTTAQLPPLPQSASKKKLTFQDTVLQHLLQTFRPTTLKELAKFLKSSETALNYVMLSLVDKQLVVSKEFGGGGTGKRSKTLYWANFDAKGKEIRHLLGDAATPAERESVRAQAAALERERASVLAELAHVLEEPSNEELQHRLESEQSELENLRQRLDNVRGRVVQQQEQQPTCSAPARPGVIGRGSAATREVACPRRLKRRINHFRDEWRKRKALCLDFVEQLADGLEKKPKEVIKVLELETDESLGVAMPAKYTDV